MNTLTTRYEFTLPRGYVDAQGRLHRVGTMRLATARDELEPLRDPMVAGPDDPRLTILVLTRVVEKLGDVSLVTSNEIEGLFAVDLAYLQDFYGVINFGSQDEYDALVRAQQETVLLGTEPTAAPEARVAAAPDGAPGGDADESDPPAASPFRAPLRAAVEELPRRAY